jgi:NAD+ kinase
LQGDFWIEKRMMINVTLEQDNQIQLSGDALNDVVISGDRFGRMILLDTFIDGTWMTTYNSDALIIATPTGSTAYALAVGGPILPPQVQNILLVPAAAHLSMDRAMVLSEGSHVEVRLAAGNRHPVQVTLDGTAFAHLDANAPAAVCIRASQYVSQFLRMRPANYFYRSLLDRLEPRFNRNHANMEEPPQG